MIFATYRMKNEKDVSLINYNSTHKSGKEKNG